MADVAVPRDPADVAVVVPGGLGALYAELLGGATILRGASRGELGVDVLLLKSLPRDSPLVEVVTCAFAVIASEDCAADALAALCAEAVGCMDVLKEETNEYIKTREQFGQPIGKFQVLQHRMVDILINCEEARSMAYVATAMMDSDDAEERARSIAAAKAQIGKSARFVGQNSIQMHGGMGMTDELKVGHYFKRLTMIDLTFGDQDHHTKRFAAMT